MADEYANGGETGQYADSQMQFSQSASYEESSGTTAGGDGTTGDKINASKNDDDESMARKIFVGGLSWETTVKDMREYFGKFGEVLDCTLKTDPATGRSRGFGFVLFGSTDAVDKVFEEQSHVLHGKTIDPKKAKARGGNKEQKEPLKKIFVGGLDPDCPESTIREHFQPFGKIEEIDLPFDKMKGVRRQFCFVTFESEEIVDKVCEQQKQQLGNKEVDVKKATPKNERNFDDWRGGGRGGRGRGGYGRGRGDGSSYNSGGGWGNQSYNYNDYYNQGYGSQGYGDYYGQGYGTGYDYNSYYGQGWGGYNQGYGGTGYQQQSTGYNQSSSYGAQQGGYKAQRGGGGGGGGGKSYHPYSRS